MELKQIFNSIDRNLTQTNNNLGFKKVSEEENSVSYACDLGAYRLVFDPSASILTFECSYENNGAETEYNTIARNLLEIENADDRDIKSISNEMIDEVERMYKVKQPVNLDKVKMPKSVSRTKAKNGSISYDVDSLANRFGALYPEYKNEIKQNVVDYGEFLPETFFLEHGNEKVLDVIKNGTAAEQKRLFKMLGEVFEDGTNEVQDVIAVTILGEMKNDPDMMAVADTYMDEYMAGPVHEVNKITAKNNKYTKKLKNPPAYKPKKKKAFNPTNALNEMNNR